MRNSILGFNQKFALTLKKQIERNNKIITIKIDCTDLVILRWFVDFYPNMNKIIIEGKEYAWVLHKKLEEDLPLIDISRASFIDRMQKLVLFNILEYKLLKENGTYSLYTFGNNYTHLINNEGECSNIYGASIQTTTKDNIIINNNKEKEKYKKEKDYPKEVENIFNYWNSKDIIIHKEVNDSITKTIKNSLNSFGSEAIKLTIDRYKQILDDQSYFFKYKWSLKDFLSRKEGISSFLDDGTKWLNYQSFLNKQSSKQMFKSNVQRKDTSRINSDGIINL